MTCLSRQGTVSRKCYLVDMYIKLSRITRNNFFSLYPFVRPQKSMIRVFSLPQNYYCPTTKDDYGTVAKINQELDLTTALTLYFIPFSAPLIVKLIKHARWWFKFFIVCDVSRWFLGIQEQHTIGPFIRGKIRRVLNKTQTFPYKRHISSEI